MQARTDTYPRHLANRLEPGIGYDVVFVHDLDGAIAVRSGDEVLDAICRRLLEPASRPAGTPRGVVRRAPPGCPNLLWVNPTAADLLRLRWSSPPSRGRRVRERAPSTDGSAALHEAPRRRC